MDQKNTMEEGRHLLDVVLSQHSNLNDWKRDRCRYVTQR